jgi:hypothetical protein
MTISIRANTTTESAITTNGAESVVIDATKIKFNLPITDTAGNTFSPASVFAADTGASLIGFKQSGTGAVGRTLQDRSEESIRVTDFMTAAQKADVVAGTATVDVTAAVQAAIDHCLSFPRAKTLEVTGLCLLTAPLIINRPVDTTISEFRIVSTGAGGGFHVASGVTMFDSTLSVSTDPLSEHIAFEGISFSAAANNLNAFVMSGDFLRVRFTGCFFNLIRCMNSSIYSQDFRFTGCKARGWLGAFFASEGAFGVTSSQGCYEFGAYGFYLPHPTGAKGVVGCAFTSNIFESGSGSFISAASVLGLEVSGNYFEANTLPSIALNFGAANKGVSVSGNLFIAAAPQLANVNYYDIEWGTTLGASSAGNYSNGRLHNTTSMTQAGLSSAGDYAEINLTKDSSTSLTSALRVAPLGRATGLDSSGIFYAAHYQNWTGLDSVYGGLAIGPGELQAGSLVPIRILSGGDNPQTNNALYGNPYWTKGSRIFASVPIVGNPKGWICTVSGLPGTWVSEGNL